MKCSECGQNPKKTRGLCSTCYVRAWRAGKHEDHKTKVKSWPKFCRRDGCNTKSRALGLCRTHYWYEIEKEETRNPPVLDEITGLFEGEEPEMLDFVGNGKIKCQECNRPTSVHKLGEFCYVRKRKSLALASGRWTMPHKRATGRVGS